MLVADDNADMREYLTRLLRAAGYRVDAVTDGQQALDAVRADPPDLVISDVMMPRLDGLALVAALRADRRTAAVPVLLLSARAGQEASIEGLQAGADDYLVKPFAAAELLARVRGNVEMARLRNHHARWRTALVDSLQEAFFVCDERGAVVEINAAFTDILGYGAVGLPYEPVYPWWPSADTDADAHRQVADAFASLMDQPHGTLSEVPVTHRDGHRVWVTVTFTHAEEPDTGHRGGGRHDAATSPPSTTSCSARVPWRRLNERWHKRIRSTTPCSPRPSRSGWLWRARRVLAVTLPARSTAEPDSPPLVCVGEPAAWDDLAPGTRQAITALSEEDLLDPATSTHPERPASRCSHPRGVLVIYMELFEQRRFTPEDDTLLTVLAGRLGQGCSGCTRSISNGRPRWHCSTRSWGRHCRTGSPCATSPPPARCRSAVTGTTSSTSTTAASVWSSATVSATGWPRPP